MEKPVLTLEETATLLGSSVKTIRNEIKAAKIKAIKVGRKTLVLRSPLEKQLAGGDANDSRG
jgi:excisionase family DNA binding protein